MEQRMEFALKALRTGNFRELCREYGISAKTGYKWRERFLRQGSGGMVEESRRPRSHPEQLSEESLCEMVRLKLAHPGWGPRKIRELYVRPKGVAASESSFKRVLERSGSGPSAQTAQGDRKRATVQWEKGPGGSRGLDGGF